MSEKYNWLLNSSSWIKYHTLVNLLNKPEDDPEVISSREDMINHPGIQPILAELQEWPGLILKRHNDSSHLLHKLTFIADLGFKSTDRKISSVIKYILSLKSEEGPFQVLVNIHPRYGGSGQDELAWFLCDAPLIVYALSKFGLKDDSRNQEAIEFLINLIQDKGWPCAVTKKLGKFRGPGRKSDPCPYANLVMLKALTQFPEYHQEDFVKKGVETLLQLWDQCKTRRPYLFGMGTDFKKLKAPFVWYDILHVLDVLTQYSWVSTDSRINEMLEIVKSKADENGRFIPESIYRPWKNWDFGQKKIPSEWLSYVVYRIFKQSSNL